MLYTLEFSVNNESIWRILCSIIYPTTMVDNRNPPSCIFWPAKVFYIAQHYCKPLAVLGGGGGPSPLDHVKTENLNK